MAGILPHKSVTPIRTMAIMVFGAYMLFAIAGLLFYGMVDDSPFVGLMRTHLALQLAWITVEGGEVVALLAFLAGGIPIGLTVLKGAIITRRRDILVLLAAPIALFALALVTRAALFAFTQHSLRAGDGVAYSIFTVANFVFLIFLVVSPVTIVLAVIRSDINAQLFHMARLPAIIMTLAMVGMLLATVGWGCMVFAYSQQDSNAAVVYALPAVFWGGIVVLMTIAASVAVGAILRQR